MLPPTISPMLIVSKNFVAGDAFFRAADDVIGDAVIATQDQRRHQAEQLLRLHVECTAFVGAAIEVEEAIDDEVVLAQDARVHALAELTELGQRAAGVVTVRVRRCGRCLAHRDWLTASSCGGC